MYTGVLSDGCGLSYSGEKVNDISQKLNSYILENYGPHIVHNLRTGSKYAGCYIITSPGKYNIEIVGTGNILHYEVS